MRTKLWIVLLLSLICLSARAAVIPIKITDYPRTNTIPADAYFLIAITNSVENTNYGFTYTNLFRQITSAIPVVVNSFTNGSNFFTVGGYWTNIGGFVQLLGGSTNTAKFDTNNNRGILIGDTNIAASYFGWPSDGQSYLSVYDGSTGHLINRWTHGVLQPSTTNGSYAVVTSQSGVNPTLTEAFVVLTNGIIASQFSINMQNTGSYLLLGGNVNDGFVGIQNGAQVSTPIGPNLIRAKWGGTDRWFLATNGAVSFFGSATNYGILWAKSNLNVSGTTLLQGTVVGNGAALFLESVFANEGIYSNGATNTGNFQTIGNIALGNSSSDLTTSSNTFRAYGPTHIHNGGLFLQDVGIAANRLMFLTAGRLASTISTVDSTEAGYLDGVTSPIQAQIDAIVTSPTAYEVLTNGVRVALGTNVNWVNSVTGYVSGSTLNLGIDSSGFAVGGGSDGSSMWTNDATVLRPIAGSTNFIGGGTGNVIATNNSYSTVSGGQANEIRSNATYAAIGGGLQNIAAPFSIAPAISGGRQNTASTNYTSIGGGFLNTASGRYTSIGGGFQNTAVKEASFIGGGDNNQADGNHATIGGGFANVISLTGTDGGGTISGGYQNSVGQDFGVVAGGAFNSSGSAKSSIGGGFANFITADGAGGNTGHSFIGGGQSNRVGFTDGTTASKWGTIAGGAHNWIRERGEYSTIGGGVFNQIEGGLGVGGTIAGGMSNLTLTGSSHVTIGGGFGNIISNGSAHSVIVGGSNNVIAASSPESTIGGGKLNYIDGGPYTTVGGGYRNRVYAYASTVSGGENNTIEQGSFEGVIGGGGANNISSNAARAFIIGGSFNKIIAGGENSGVMGQFVTNSTPSSIELGYYNTNKVRIDYTNLTLVGGMKIKMTNGAANGAVLTSDANGVGTWVAGGGGGGGGGSGPAILSMSGLGTNTTFYGNIAVDTNVLVVTNGNVGIGTNAPTASLHVRPTASGYNYLRVDDTNGTPRIQMGVLSSSSARGAIWLSSATPGDANPILYSDGVSTTKLNSPSSTASLSFSQGDNSRWHIVSGGHFVAGTDNTYDIGASGANRPRDGYLGRNLSVGANTLYVTNGNVGIGTTAPQDLVHVLASGLVTAPASYGATTDFIIQDSGSAGTDVGLTLISGNTAQSLINFGDTDAYNVGMIVYNHSDNSFRFRTADAERVRISILGNVGIGTNAPAARLQVTADNSADFILQAGTTNRPSLMTLNTNGLLTTPSANIRTNIGTMDVTTNLFVLGTRVTNGTRRIFVAASAQLNAAAAGTAKVTLYVENAGSATNRLSVAAGPLASLTTVEALFMAVSPGSIYYFADETSGAGATVSLVPETCSVTAF